LQSNSGSNAAGNKIQTKPCCSNHRHIITTK
jgi:hypothetical protein